MKYLIGFDVGTTSVKAGVFTTIGEVVSTFSEEYGRQTTNPGWVEQDPQDWLRLIEKALTSFAEQIDLASVQAVCIASQVNTHVFCDEKGRALMPAIVWQDTRAKDYAADLDSSFSQDEKMEIWGNEFVLDASYSLSRAVWVANEQPDVWKKTKYIFSPKDFCTFAMTGIAATDAFSSVGLVSSDGSYVSGLDRLLPGFMSTLPELRDMFSTLGPIRMRQFPTLTAPLVVGTMDAWANFLGSGLVRAGEAALIAGTSSIVGVMSDENIPTKGVISFPPFEGKTIHAGPTQSGSDAFAWFARAHQSNVGDLLSKLQDRPITDTTPIFLPHLEGERAPIWDPNARGVFFGLNSSHSEIDLALAVAEGVAFSERQLFAECCNAAGFVPDALNISGGASVSEKWGQIRANALGITLRRLETKDSGVLGAAIIAGVGVGVYENATEAADRLVTELDKITPNEDQSLVFRRYKMYRSIYRQLKPLFDDFTSTTPTD